MRMEESSPLLSKSFMTFVISALHFAYLFNSDIFYWVFYKNIHSTVKCDSSWMLQMKNTKATFCLSYQKEQFQQYKGRHFEACCFQLLWNACILFWVSKKITCQKTKEKATTGYCVPVNIASALSRSEKSTKSSGWKQRRWTAENLQKEITISFVFCFVWFFLS